MNNNYAQLIRQAQAVLDDNWTGTFTKPAPRLYPHQWSWDSAFIAIARAHYDQVQAEQELRSLFQGQWENGLLPHIVFNPEYTAYSPGPDFWKTECSPHAPHDRQTSGIVQPPIHATAVLHIYRCAQDKTAASAFLAEMFPRLRSWHTYLYRERDPQCEALVYIRHPWESGQDNSPIWDAVLRRIEPLPDEVPAYSRMDIQIVNAEERPSNTEYDRYAYLVRLFANRNYDESRIRKDCPFLVQDVLFNTLLCQANRDLAEIARILGEDATTFEVWAKETAESINAKLWNDEHAIYVDFDLRMNEPIHAHAAAGFAPLYAEIPDEDQAQRMCSYLNTACFCGLDEACYSVPSYDKHEPDYSPSHYWRGPIWININWLLYRGLLHYGFHKYAHWVRQSIVELPRRSGFYEYYDSDDGQGHGSDHFSWTAALLLDVLYEDNVQREQPAEENKVKRDSPRLRC